MLSGVRVQHSRWLEGSIGVSGPMVRFVVVMVEVTFYRAAGRVCYGKIDGGVAPGVAH
jgi:hypothetical protein